MGVVASAEYLARSTTTTSVGVIGYLIIGGLAGWVAGKIVKLGGSGILINILIGVAGALLGGFLLSFAFETESWGWFLTFFTALLGSIILLSVVGLVRRRKLN
jgi:uncharacterized membrane protein YeaQ/YmgE (transglycosylase-associated protein family)